MSSVKLYDIRWVSHTAGPSPITNEFGPNCRIELFFMGCKKAREGNPCPECFNPGLWADKENVRLLDPKDMVQHIMKHSDIRYITIVGGEPFDQPEGLTELCENLRLNGFHIIVFTHYEIKEFKEWSRYSSSTHEIINGWTKQLFHRFLKAIDILVDGSYNKEERIYDESIQDGFHDAVGSGNQIVWDMRTWRNHNYNTNIYGIPARDIQSLSIDKNDGLQYCILRGSRAVF